MFILIFALLGLITAVFINILADHLPEKQTPQMPYCLQCGHAYGAGGWLGIGRWLFGSGICPQCGQLERKRPPLVEIVTPILFALLPILFDDPRIWIVYAVYLAILILIIVIDLEHKLILNAVTYPSTIFAIAGALILPNSENSWPLALAGALFGFVVFFFLYWLGEKLLGAGALGFGDVKLAMLMGAMLGLHRIPFALTLGVVLGGVGTLLILLFNRRVGRYTALPYGQYLAAAAIFMIYWGTAVAAYYLP